MPEQYTAKSSILIDAQASRVWEALTEPAMVKQWLFGTDMSVSAWEKGGEIRYHGVWEGKEYEDKGTILEIIPEKKLVSTYWSGLSGKEDIPENYQKVTYELVPEGNATKLTITQEGNPTEESAKHSENNWGMVLDNLKRLSESK